MRTVLAIFRRDLMRILRNPVALVVTIGVAILPSLYAWFNILALWDPYSNTGNIPVAVVNLDRGADSAVTGRINAGRSVVEALKDNKSLGWQFVDDESAAVDRVHSGRCYAAIIIPKGFSDDLIGIVDGSGTRPALDYYVNEKKNAIAPKVTDTGASTIDQQINSIFVSTVSDALASKVLQARGDSKGAAEQTRGAVVSDINGAISDLDQMRTSLKGTDGSLDQARRTVGDSKKNVDDLVGQIEATRSSLSRSRKEVDQARRGVLSFSTDLNGALTQGSMQLSGTVGSVNAAAGNIDRAFNDTGDKVDRVTSSLGQVVDANDRAIKTLKEGLASSGLQPGDPVYDSVQEQLDQLQKTADKQRQALDDFTKGSSDALESGRKAADDLTGAMSQTAGTGADALNQASRSLTGSLMPGLLGGVDDVSAAAGDLDGTLSGLSTAARQTRGLLDQLDSTIGQTQTTVESTQKSLTSIRSDLDGVRTDVAALGSSAAWKRISQAIDLNPSAFGQAMAAPVSLETHTVYPVKNYGSSVAPFYTNLALWVGGFILIAIYKLEVDKEGIASCSARQAYLGRWLLLVFVGLFQAVIATVGDLMLGIQCEKPLLFVLAGVFSSFVYINIIYALAATFRHIGKALAVVLVILQIPGSSGMYPIEMMPDFFRNLNPWLPFTYGINAMRETIGGMYGADYWQDMLHVFWYLPVALLIGLVIRRYLLNLNALFDRRLGATDLMLTEQNHSADFRLNVSSLVRSFVGEGGDYRRILRGRAHRFLALYPYLIRVGLFLVLLPVLFLVLLFSTEAKIVMLIACIASIVLIDTYLIVVEYICDSYVHQLGLSEVPGGGLRDLLLPSLAVDSGRGEEGGPVPAGEAVTGRLDRVVSAGADDNDDEGGERR
ncbi:YhgE/Pip domain-containing protein [Bifidobacterium favimelis]|uniref:YhgE/Pip domain-containing protein n=1 Tax=Bifidobacterium favimelis TaxID=3122979 RepID=A0ABU8ZPV4_9BIFI